MGDNDFQRIQSLVEQYQNQYAQLQGTQNSLYLQASQLQKNIEKLKNENLTLEGKNRELKEKYKIV